MQTQTGRGPRGRVVTLLLLLVAIVLAMFVIWYIGGQKTTTPEPLGPIVVMTPTR